MKLLHPLFISLLILVISPRILFAQVPEKKPKVQGGISMLLGGNYALGASKQGKSLESGQNYFHGEPGSQYGLGVVLMTTNCQFGLRVLSEKVNYRMRGVGKTTAVGVPEWMDQQTKISTVQIGPYLQPEVTLRNVWRLSMGIHFGFSTMNATNSNAGVSGGEPNRTKGRGTFAALQLGCSHVFHGGVELGCAPGMEWCTDAFKVDGYLGNVDHVPYSYQCAQINLFMTFKFQQ